MSSDALFWVVVRVSVIECSMYYAGPHISDPAKLAGKRGARSVQSRVRPAAARACEHGYESSQTRRRTTRCSAGSASSSKRCCLLRGVGAKGVETKTAEPEPASGCSTSRSCWWSECCWPMGELLCCSAVLVANFLSSAETQIWLVQQSI